ncbi:MAG: XRE family transcriptional regulator [Rhodocyclaceae bacterium]|nr:XRE family transcriptional regulator [Rhodocyclaceae bacterium]
MLAGQFGNLIKSQRRVKDVKQVELARRARVSRTVLSRLEQGEPRPVRTDVLDRIFEALEISPRLAMNVELDERRRARLEQQVALEQQRNRHLRLAIDLATRPDQAAERIAKARMVVELWRSKGTCSPLYVERWLALLALPAGELARCMGSLGEWEDALFQNTPWSWAWT